MTTRPTLHTILLPAPLVAPLVPARRPLHPCVSQPSGTVHTPSPSLCPKPLLPVSPTWTEESKMQKDRTDLPEESQHSRSSSRSSSVSLPHSATSFPRKDSQKKEKRSPLCPASANDTPNRNARPSLDFMVTGKQILTKADRANSLPGSYRRPSSATPSPPVSAPRTRTRTRQRAESVASREPSPEDDLTLDLSQISNLGDTLSKYSKAPLATSTPNPSNDVTKQPSSRASTSTSTSTSTEPAPSDVTDKTGREASRKAHPSEVSPKPSSGGAGQKTRSASLYHMQPRSERRTKAQQSVDLSCRSQQSMNVSSRISQQSVDLCSRRSQQSTDNSSKPSRDSTFSYSRDSLYKTHSSASPHRYGTEYSSVSPEYSQSSAELSPRDPSPVLSSCCSYSWESTQRPVACGECGAVRGAGVEGGAGEWRSFWSRYNSALPYDQCPTPYRPDQTDADWPDNLARSPEGIQQMSSVIRREGIHLSPSDAQRVIRSAHLLGLALSRAVDRRALTRTPRDATQPKPTLSLDLTQTTAPAPVTLPPAATNEVTTQTDISLPNTKSAPRIFESILRQLSKSSIDEPELAENDEN